MISWVKLNHNFFAGSSKGLPPVNNIPKPRKKGFNSVLATRQKNKDNFNTIDNPLSKDKTARAISTLNYLSERRNHR